MESPKIREFDALAADLFVAGSGYLRLGLDYMHRHTWAQGAWVQPAVANIAIGVELMCKSYLSHANPLLIFDRVQPEVAWAVHRPGSGFDRVPYERVHTLLEAGANKTIGIAECIRLLQIKFPSKVQALGEWGRRLASWRAVCVHFVLPDVETRAIQRVAYAALSIATLLSEDTDDMRRRFSVSKDDLQFLNTFDRERARDLDARVEAAKKKVKNMNGRVMIGLSADYAKELTCEVCGNDGIAYGARGVGDGFGQLVLSEFACDECGLQLLGSDEMQQCGFETVHEVDSV